MILDDIVVKKRKRIEERKKYISTEEMKNKALKLLDNNYEKSFKKALKEPGLSVIAEYKRATSLFCPTVRLAGVPQFLHFFFSYKNLISYSCLQ